MSKFSNFGSLRGGSKLEGLNLNFGNLRHTFRGRNYSALTSRYTTEESLETQSETSSLFDNDQNTQRHIRDIGRERKASLDFERIKE